MKEYKKTKTNENVPKLSKLGFRIMAVLSALLIAAVGILCTSPSKAVDEAPYFPDETEEVTEEETTRPEPQTEAETLAPFDTEGVTFSETEPTDTDVTGTESADDTTDKAVTDPVTDKPDTTAPDTTARETTEYVTEPPVTDKNEQNASDEKQQYKDYNGRKYGENETFVGEYKTDRVSVGVSNVKKGDLNYYICDIKVKSVKDFHTAFANNSLAGRAYTSKIAQSVGAGFAVNGDFCGFRQYGIIIREGGLYRNKSADGWDLCYMNKYGDLITCNNDKQDGKELVNGGAWQSWCFGPTLVENYKAVENFNTPDLSSKDWAREPRTAIGQIDELHYIILVVDAIRAKKTIGWETVGGMNFRELADTMADLGCKAAYNLDGGGSTTMWLNGEVANEPSGDGQREISDIIYLK